MNQLISSTVHQWGYIAILLFMALESCGIPIPSEIVMPVAGLFAFQGHLNLIVSICMGTAGNLMGSVIAYILARQLGEHVVVDLGRRVGLSHKHFDNTKKWFSRYGGVTIGVGRIIPVFRTYVSFPAGLAKYPFLLFCILTIGGAAVWSTFLAGVGYGVGSSYTHISSYIEKGSIVMAIFLVVILAMWYVHGRRKEVRTSEKAEM